MIPMSLSDAIGVFEHKLRLAAQGRSIESLQLYDAMRVMLATVKKSTPSKETHPDDS